MIHQIHNLVWGPALLGLLLFTGLFFTIRSRGFQFWGIGIWWDSTVGSLFRRQKEDRQPLSEHWEMESWQERTSYSKANEKTGSITKLQAACTALAATIGTGNIVGVASALTAGGPGAIFWGS